MAGPLLTREVHAALRKAAQAGTPTLECSLDLGRSVTRVDVDADGWVWQGKRYPFLEACKDRTIYHWVDESFQPVQRFTTALIKLVPTDWGPPTFEIDGIKMHPTERVSPYADAERKVGLIRPRGKAILDTCGGLGYTAAACLKGGAKQILSYEKNEDVIWLRGINPWSPKEGGALTLIQGNITEHISGLADGSIDAILHDPPRFGIAGELYSQAFYGQLARVLKRKGLLFHYTGSPNKLTTGRDVPREVAQRLRQSGFKTEPSGDGVLAERIS
jgi:predicted methyltransferase